MATHDGGHGSPEAGLPGGLVEVLTRWEDAGGHWRVLTSRDDWIEIGLLTCDGAEQMSRVSGTRTSPLAGYLRGRTSSTE